MSGARRTDPKRCAGTTRDGRSCRAVAASGGWCFGHDPARAAERDAARRRGGHNSAKLVRLHRLVPPRLLPVYAALEAALSEVHSKTLDPKRATAMAAIARAMVAVLQAGEVEERVREIEATLARRPERSVEQSVR